MKKASFIGVLLASTLAMGTASANPEEVSLYVTALAEGRVISLEDAGLSSPDTLWVPGRYIRGSQNSALYIKGVRWVAPDGQNNVGGFTYMDDGSLMVVTVQESVTLDDAQVSDANNPKYSVFYKVSPEGKTIGKIGVLKGLGWTVTAKTGIFVAQGVGKRHSYNLSGYSTAGAPIAGPQGMWFAAPFADGGWWVARERDASRGAHRLAYSYVSPSGEEKYVRNGPWLNTHEFLHTANAMVNMPTYADTVRTGFTMLLTYKGVDGFESWWGSVHNMSLEAPEGLVQRGFSKKLKPITKAGHYDIEYGSTKRMSIAAAEDLAIRNGLISVNEKVYMIGQMGANETKGLYVGLNDLKAQEGAQQQGTPLFKLEGTGMNLARTVFGGNTGAATASSRNDAYVFIKPTGAVAVFAYMDAALDGDIQTYDVETGSVVDLDETLSFLRAHQITN